MLLLMALAGNVRLDGLDAVPQVIDLERKKREES
jgi:hypothetical protein